MLALAAHVPAQTTHDLMVTDYWKRGEAALFDAGQRHLELGSWARKQGLVPQATTQFLRAVEVSEGKNANAVTVLGIMRGYGDLFWRGERKRPPTALVTEYERRAAGIERKTRRAHAELAQWAGKCKLTDEAKTHWLAVLRLGGVLEADSKGAWKLDGEALPDELADWLKAQTIAVNGSTRGFDAAGASAPKLPDVHEQRSDELVVRTDLPGDAASKLHALCTALLPHLRTRLDGAPTRALGLFVFGKRADYVAYLKACHAERYAAATGFAEYGTFQTLVCAEGLADPDLHAIVLHELSHLYFFGAAPAAMPDWYAEGFAESFGGQGTFSWDGKVLQLGGLMRKDRFAAMQKDPLPLRELLLADAAMLLATDHDKGMRFYTECWALQRFLRQDKNPWQARFLQFEAQCRGAVLGAPEGGRRFGDPGPAKMVFDRLFGKDLDQMEAAFCEWLGRL